jgi:hypothetical protein
MGKAFSHSHLVKTCVLLSSREFSFFPSFQKEIEREMEMEMEMEMEIKMEKEKVHRMKKNVKVPRLILYGGRVGDN